jgi:hypothetical protein
MADLDGATSLAPAYPNWFTEGVGVDQLIAKALAR